MKMMMIMMMMMMVVTLLAFLCVFHKKKAIAKKRDGKLIVRKRLTPLSLCRDSTREKRGEKVPLSLHFKKNKNRHKTHAYKYESRIVRF